MKGELAEKKVGKNTSKSKGLTKSGKSRKLLSVAKHNSSNSAEPSETVANLIEMKKRKKAQTIDEQVKC